MAIVTNRNAEIANVIRNHAIGITGDDERALAAKVAKGEADEAAIGTRERIMGDLADLADDGDWTAAEVDTACDMVREGKVGNDPESADSGKMDVAHKALATFVSDLKRVMHPMVRRDFHTIRKAIKDAWAQEDALIEAAKIAKTKKPNTPVRKLWSRKYHALNSIAKTIIDHKGKVSLTTMDELIQWAVDHNPDEDPAKVEARLKSIITGLEVMSATFPLSDLIDAIKFLGAITGEELIAAKAYTKPQATKPEPVSGETIDGECQDVTAPEPMEGAYDVDVSAQLDKLVLLEAA